MSGRSVILCLLSYFFFMADLTVCHQREAPEGKFYEFSKMKGCVFVESEEPCPITWQLNPFMAKGYKPKSEIVRKTITFLKDNGIDDRCIQSVQRVLCSQLTPRCSADGSRDYGEVMTICQDIENTCPVEFREKFDCQGLETGKHPSLQCVSPPASINGACPRPEFKMPDEFLTKYEKQSANLVQTIEKLENLNFPDNGERMFSSKCVSQLRDTECQAFYCSADESQLLIKQDRDNCKKIVKECLDEVLTKLSDSTAQDLLKAFVTLTRENLLTTCETFPVASEGCQHDL